MGSLSEYACISDIVTYADGYKLKLLGTLFFYPILSGCLLKNSQCFISYEHFTTRIINNYWRWVAGLWSFFTAVVYFIKVHNKALLPAGFLWIGFPLKGSRTIRIGLVSIDSSDHDYLGRLMWSFSLFEIKTPRRTIRVMLPVPLQYFEDSPLKGDDDHTDAMEMATVNGSPSQPTTPASRPGPGQIQDKTTHWRASYSDAFRLLM
jgi:hypothetical protein